jgi:hypothetical protein
MEPCNHLREDPQRAPELVVVTDLHESSHYGAWLLQCGRCDQVYLNCYVEAFDDSWSFYAPVSAEEAAQLRATTIHEDSPLVRELVTSRRYLVWPPSWKPGGFYWDEGPDDVLTMGARPW